MATIEADNVELLPHYSFIEQVKMLKKFFFEKGDKYPAIPLPQKKVKMDQLQGSTSGVKAAWLGHSSLLINIDGVSILTDPVFEKSVSMVGPSRFTSEHPLVFESLFHVDVVIISHNHYDHLNKKTIRALKDKVGMFVVPLGVGRTLRKWGVSNNKITQLDWWSSHRVNSDVKITATPGQHFSGRGLFDRNSSLWASWVIQSENHRVFFSGDSGYFGGFSEIGKVFGPFDVTFLECGAYNERWAKVHMFPEETVQAFVDLKGKILQPIHWATYNLAFHSWFDPIVRLVQESERRNVKLSVPLMGQVVDYNDSQKISYWWEQAIKVQKAASGNSGLVLTGD